MKKAAVTIKDVSAKCGLSVSTVSKALNNYDDISPETRELVHRMAREIGYHPSAVARTLKTNHSYNLGVLFHEASDQGITHHFFAAILNAFKQAGEERGYDITFITHNIGGRAMTYLEHCRYRNVDGVCVVCADYYNPEVQELSRSGIPCVTIDHVYPSCACVLSDNEEGLRMLVEKAAGLGHKRIAYAFGQPSLVTEKRISGFRSIMQELGLPVPDEYVTPCCYTSPESGFESMKRLMTLSEPPTCVLMSDDHTALGALNAAEEMGLRVPEDVSVGGFDGIRLTQMLTPRMTTIRQDTDRIGREAAALLVDLIQNDARRASAISVPTGLIDGQTIGPVKG